MDKTAKIWDITTESLLHTLSDFTFPVTSVSFSPTNAILASGEGNYDSSKWVQPKHNTSIKLWNITDGELLDTLGGHTNLIYSVSFSHDGTKLVSGSWDWTIKLWGNHSPITPSPSLDYWPTSNPEEQCMNTTKLNEFSEFMETYDLHGMVIIRNGVLIYERYYPSSHYTYSIFSKHKTYSVTGGFTATLVGIAIDKGFITSKNQKVLDFFPNRTFLNTDSRKKTITIENLLTMRSGIRWAAEDTLYMVASPDSVQYTLDQPMEAQPGTEFDYNQGASHVLSAIIEQTSGLSTADFAMQYLFEPLDIESSDVVWQTDQTQNVFGFMGLHLTPRNMAKLGQLYLDNGKWNGNQIVSEDWIQDAITEHTSQPSIGYNWKLFSDYYKLYGKDGQEIIVVPDHNLVVVFTSGNVAGSSLLNILLNAIISNCTPITTTPSLTTNLTTTSLTITTTNTRSVATPFSLTPVLYLLSMIISIVVRQKRRKYT
jgi:CubicO group peptidase (beta-lactamase class C family)